MQAAGASFPSLSQLLPDDSDEGGDGGGEGNSLATACAAAKALQAGASGPYAPLQPTCCLFFCKVAPDAADAAAQLQGMAERPAC